MVVAGPNGAGKTNLKRNAQRPLCTAQLRFKLKRGTENISIPRESGYAGAIVGPYTGVLLEFERSLVG
jgi:hypothetical protein